MKMTTSTANLYFDTLIKQLKHLDKDNKLIFKLTKLDNVLFERSRLILLAKRASDNIGLFLSFEDRYEGWEITNTYNPIGACSISSNLGYIKNYDPEFIMNDAKILASLFIDLAYQRIASVYHLRRCSISDLYGLPGSNETKEIAQLVEYYYFDEQYHKIANFFSIKIENNHYYLESDRVVICDVDKSEIPPEQSSLQLLAELGYENDKYVNNKHQVLDSLNKITPISTKKYKTI